MKEEQILRLDKAYTLEKYGHLETWHELYLYQLFALTKHRIDQLKEIAQWAQRANRGEKILLPLMRMITTEPLPL